MCLTMRRLCGWGLSFGTGTERIAPESLTPGIVLLRSPQHIAQKGLGSTRSSLTPAFKRWFDDEILKSRGVPESNQTRGRVNRDSERSVIPDGAQAPDPKSGGSGSMFHIAAE